MMKWYKAYYRTGSRPGVEMVNFHPGSGYCFGTYDRMEAFNRAKQIAREKHLTVTVSASWGDGTCVRSVFWRVNPSGTVSNEFD